MVVIGEFENVLGFITAILYPLLRHHLPSVPSPGLSSPSPDVSCSNPLEVCPTDSRGFASFSRDYFTCCYIPISDIPLFRGPKFCNNDTTSNSVCFSPRPVQFPYHRSRGAVFTSDVSREYRRLLSFRQFLHSLLRNGLRGASRASHDVYDGIVRVFASGS